VGDNGLVVVFEEFETKTGGRFDALDLTGDVADVVTSSGVRNGNALVFSPHTTCCIVIAPSDPETVRSLEQLMDVIAPADRYYAHDDLTIRTENLVEDEPPNAPAHLFHVFAGKASECIPIVDGALALGEGQRVLFLELDSSRPRRYLVQVVGE
jgi:secondary thiamine-phosphate synthase enzyme